MIVSSVRLLMTIAAITVFFSASQAQTGSDQPARKESLPYKVLTSGKHLTIKSNRNIQHVMLWTTTGHRVVEQKEINAGSYSFTIPINEKVYFLMVELDDDKVYTEKIGVQ